jgi:UDP-N-acetylmuramoylalanine--D-glutamate ligase
MIEVFPFAGLPVAVFGLGRSGKAAVQGLKLGDAEVWAWDDNEDVRAKARATGIPLVDLYVSNWKELTSLVLSPGVPHKFPEPHPVVKLALAAGCEVIGDIELLARTQRDCAYIGVTGTNGKSTTTALIGHIMQVSGRDAEVGGNLGVPALELLPMGGDGVYVLEMSSFQLELTLSITFDVAVLLNISADHLDRYDGMDGYIAAKKSIFNRQTAPRTAVVGVDDDFSRAICGELKAASDAVVVPISGRGRVPGGVYVEDGILYDGTEGAPQAILDLKPVASLPGVHNWQNAAAAYAATKAAGVDPRVVMACIQSYPGLVHRQEMVSVVDGVGYVNDSKATNPDAAAWALACYDPIYWIAGGRSKDGGLEALEPYLGRIAHAYLIGEAADAFAQALDGKVEVTLSGDLESAVKQAGAQAKKDKAAEPVVLLSPACASFDQFDNFEARGDAFRDLVEKLPGRHEESFESADGEGQ